MTFSYEPDEHGNGFLVLTESRTNVRTNIDDHDINDLRRIIEHYEEDNGEVEG
ncbi:hypothetical protein [Halococcus sp. AFM35]|uniref:hypothetical protein n=1 Tax=Halococcus sp. AFM35 TaxID=3421653 RepID=UPI003EBB17E2